jgi:hypothetical protein
MPTDYSLAVVLNDGRVFLTVSNGQGYSTEAGLYDPATSQFVPTGSLGVDREMPSITLLPDGRVLLAGGQTCTMPANGGSASCKTLSTAQVFDAAAGKFAATGSMKAARSSPIAVRLADGRVLVTGGFNNGQLVTSAELYDTKTGKFTATGSLVSGIYVSCGILLQDGRVLLIGDSAGATQIYDPKKGQFAKGPSMVKPHNYGIPTLLSDGRVLVTGGAESLSGDQAGTADAEIFDPATEAFSATGSMSVPRVGHTATRLADGRVLITGGQAIASLFSQSASQQFYSSAELFDPSSGKFSPAGSMTEARGEPLAVLLPDGKVLICGGWSGLSHLSRTAEFYLP